MESISSGTNISQIRSSFSSLLETKKLPIDQCEWEGYFDESGHLVKSWDFISSSILDRPNALMVPTSESQQSLVVVDGKSSRKLGLDPSVRSEAWKFLTGYYPWSSSRDERLAVEGVRRKNYESLAKMYNKIQPLLETEHRGFSQVCRFINSDLQRLYTRDAQGQTRVDKKQMEKILLLSYVCNMEAEYQQGLHEMLLLFHLLAEQEHEIYWLFQFFLQKTEHSCVMNIGVGKNLIMLKALIAFMDPTFAKHLEGKGTQVIQSLFPWFCFSFQRVFKSFYDVWRLWEVFLTGKPCRNFQVIVAYTLLQTVRDQILRENMGGDDILMLCGNLVDLDADQLISEACSTYDRLLEHADKVPAALMEFFTQARK